MHKAGKNPSIVAWEITRRCGLRCKHCRGSARDCDYTDEFSTEECLKTIDSLASFSTPMIILTGGEPLMREDIFEVAGYATARGCRVVLATCGHLLTFEKAVQLKNSGVMAVSLSLDAATEDLHDCFRGVKGAYKKTVGAIECLKRAGLPFQINVTVSKINSEDLPKILEDAVELGASAVDFFFLVPTGRGSEIADLALSAADRDRVLEWIAAQAAVVPVQVRTTCAPQYKKFLSDDSSFADSPFRGCMGGRGFVFISHTGILQTCGFLDVPCGDLRAVDFDFGVLYEQSDVFKNMRRLNPFAGCPARSFARTGDYMRSEEE